MAITVLQQINGILSVGNSLIAMHLRYLYGGKDLNGEDCSGFTTWCYLHGAGIQIGAGTEGQLQISNTVFQGYNFAWNNILPHLQLCDLIFPSPTHVQMYAGNGMVMEEPHTGGFAQLVPQWSETIYAVRRPLATITPVVNNTWPGVDLELKTPNLNSQEVIDWQTQLRKLGYEISVDGDFGPITDKITRKFQADHKLLVDGIVGQISWSAAFK